MIVRGMITAWILGSFLLFICWDMLPRHAKREFDKADQVQNPIARQGCLFAVLLKYLFVTLLVGAIFLAIGAVAFKLGLFDNTPIFH